MYGIHLANIGKFFSSLISNINLCILSKIILSLTAFRLLVLF